MTTPLSSQGPHQFDAQAQQFALSEKMQARVWMMLTAFAEGITSVVPTLSSKIAFTATDSSLLRGYLSLQRRADDDEIAITIDIWTNADQLSLEVDICTDHGEVLVAGPRTALPMVGDRSDIGTTVDEWLRELQRLLDAHRQTVLSAATKLV
ncbi:MAG: hypothetical protein V4787_10960 [Pseudomonadota bacterium]